MFIYFILFVVIISIIKLYSLVNCPKEMKDIPSAPIWSFFTFLLSNKGFNEKMKQDFQPLLDKYGVIRVYTIHGWSLYIGDAKICKEICFKSDVFHKPNVKDYPASENFLRFLGKSHLGVNNGQEWMRHRKIINPIFNKTWSTEMLGTCVQDLIEEWEKQDGQEVKVHDLIQRMTIDILGKAIFEIDFKAIKDANSHLFNLYNSVSRQIIEQTLYLVIPFMEYVPYFRRPNLAKELNEYHEFVERIMQLRKEELQDKSINQKDNLVTSLINSNENTEESKLTWDEIRDTIKIFILAGHDTTSNTLTSTLYYLARYPEIQDKLRKEVLEALDQPNKVTIPTIEQLQKIPYMDLVNKESMRSMTTATVMERATAEKYTLSNGMVVPKGTSVFLNLWSVHHNPSAFPNPSEFNPSRFEDMTSEESRNWQPFISGPRTCIGMSFSMMEQRVTIAMLLQKFEFSISNENPDYHQLRLSPISLIRPIDLNLNIKVRI